MSKKKINIVEDDDGKKLNVKKEKENDDVFIDDKQALMLKEAEKQLIKSVPPLEKLREEAKKFAQVVNPSDKGDVAKSSKGLVNFKAQNVILTSDDGKVIKMDNYDELLLIRQKAIAEKNAKIQDKMSNTSSDDMVYDDDWDDEEEE